jgi:hypothetical protein
MGGLVLQHACEQAGTLDFDLTAAHVDSGDTRPVGSHNREFETGHRETTLIVIVGCRRTADHLGHFQYRVYHNATVSRRPAAILRTVINEYPQPNPDLWSSKTDTSRLRQRVIHIGDQVLDGRGK